MSTAVRHTLCAVVILLLFMASAPAHRGEAAATASSGADASDLCFAEHLERDAGDTPRTICAADLDGDHDLDLAVTNQGGNDISILVGDGDGTFLAPAHYAVGYAPIAVCAADLDGDDDIDLAVANNGSVDVSVLINNGDGTYQAAVNYDALTEPVSICAADIDGDSDIDLVVGGHPSEAIMFRQGFIVLRNNGNGTFQPYTTQSTGFSPQECITMDDFDGDGDMDAAIALAGGPVIIRMNDGNGEYPYPESSSYDLGYHPMRICSADLDGDEDIDLAVTCGRLDADSMVEGVTVVINNGGGTFQESAHYPVGHNFAEQLSSICTADLNGDNRADLVVTDPNGQSISILINNGDGTFRSSLDFTVVACPVSVCAAGLDGDNDLDLVMADSCGNNVSVLLNCLDPETPYADVDVLPGQCPNLLNMRNLHDRTRDVTPLSAMVAPASSIPVALAGGPFLDIRDIDPTAVSLGGVQLQSHKYADVTGSVPRETPCDCWGAAADGYVDLILNFDKAAVLAALDPEGDREQRTLDLTAHMKDGRVLDGRDCLTVIGGKPRDPDVARLGNISNDAVRSDFRNELEHMTAIDADDLDSIITAVMYAFHVPGVAAHLLLNDETIWSGTYGYADLESMTPVEDTTMFFLASVSKPFVGVALLQLWENGEFDLDDDINSYLPSTLQIRNPHWPDKAITFRMVMTHTSSLGIDQMLLEPYWVCGTDSPIPLGSFLTDFLTPGGAHYSVAHFETYAPGEGYRYSNVNAALAAYLLEAITGTPFDQYCEDSIFTPLGMNNTSWTLAGSNPDNLAMPCYWDTDPEGLDSMWFAVGHCGRVDYPAHRLRSSANDLSRFLRAMLGRGRWGEVQILDSASVDSMATDYVSDLVPWYPDGIGLFLSEQVDDFGWSRWGHSGAMPGAATAFGFCEARNSGEVVLLNLGAGEMNGDYGPSQTASEMIQEAVRAFCRAYDSDADDVPDVSDNCIATPNPGQEDADTDGIGDLCDNCAQTFNPDQADSNIDGHGDACDCICPRQADFDGDGFLDALDLNALIDALFFGGINPQDADCPTTRGDFDNSGFPDALDLNALIDHLFFGGVGPADPCSP